MFNFAVDSIYRIIITTIFCGIWFSEIMIGGVIEDLLKAMVKVSINVRNIKLIFMK